MKRFRPKVLVFALTLCFCILPASSWAQDAAPATVVLDSSGFWRQHLTLKPPVVIEGNALKTLPTFDDTPLPAGNWMKSDFDDTTWVRLPGPPFAAHYSWSVVSRENVGFVANDESSPSLALLCLRGKFEVTDPAKVKGLSLSVAYRGGVVVYLNGHEVTRASLPAKAEAGMLALATPYPDEAYLKPDGSLLQCDAGDNDPANVARWRSRTRTIDEFAIPPTLLRKGVNVLAIEVHRSAYNNVLFEKTRGLGRNGRVDSYLWSTCGLVSARLNAGSTEGIVPNVVRAKGLTAWNSDPCTPDFDLDYGDRTEALRPLRIVGTRGGMFSAKVCVGSDAPIKGLQATVTDLTGRAGAIAKSNILVRYALPTSSEPGSERRYTAGPGLFDGLSETPLAEVPVREKSRVRGNWVLPGQPKTVFGAVQPVWVTVNVPVNAAPGDYTGTLTITAAGEQPIQTPVQLSVSAWTLPSSREYHTTVDLIQSPESVAMRYGVKPYSDEHFKLLGASFDRLGEAANWTVYVPLVCHTNQGNDQTMVRWIAKPGGSYDYDFSAFERYIDLAVERMGKPRVIVLYAWDVFLGLKSQQSATEGAEVPVSLLDPQTGEVTLHKLPAYAHAKSVTLWKPLYDGILSRLKKRGLEHTLALGVGPDGQPDDEAIAFFKTVLPGVPWMRQSHSNRRDFNGIPIGWQCLVWTPTFVTDPSKGSLYGWKRPENWTQFCRSRTLYPMSIARLLGEMNIQGNQRGFGRIGLDFWPVLKDARGRLTGSIQARYPESDWRNLDWMIRDFVPAGPEGALSSARLMMMREGVQECEARIFVERALTDPALAAKLGKGRAARLQALMNQRTLDVTIAMDNHMVSGFAPASVTNHGWWSDPKSIGYIWYLGSGWQDQSKALYDAAGEVARTQKVESGK